MRSTDMQTWPEFWNAPQVAALTAFSMSALFSTIIGSLPPSSALTGVSVSAAWARTFLAVRSEPVNWTKSTSSTRAEPVSAVAVDDVEDVGAADVALPGLDDLADAERRHLGGLDHDRGARLERGSASPSDRISGKFQGLITPTTG